MDVGGALTRKLGPLPTWAWGAVVGGAILGVKILRGGSGGSSGGAVASVGGDGADLLPGAPGPAGEQGEQGLPGLNGLDGLNGIDGTDGTPGADSPIGGLLPGIIDSIADLTNAGALQNQLSEALRALSGWNASRNYWLALRNDVRLQYADGKIDKATYDAKYAEATSRVNLAETNIASQQTTIASLQAQLTDIFAAPAAA